MGFGGTIDDLSIPVRLDNLCSLQTSFDMPRSGRVYDIFNVPNVD